MFNHLEQLENRKHFSATVVGDALNVVGTSGADTFNGGPGTNWIFA